MSFVSSFAAGFATDVRTAEAPLRFGNTARFDIARRRIGITGDIGRIADFQIEHELAAEGGWRDVYVNYRQLDHRNIQAGHFKLPCGLDENTSSTNLDFVYRSRAATLSPGRDQGVMAHGRVGVFRYAGGVFLRDGDNGREDGVARLAFIRSSPSRAGGTVPVWRRAGGRARSPSNPSSSA
jgi:phosphate-selective porin